jgi:hypothetical protein
VLVDGFQNKIAVCCFIALGATLDKIHLVVRAVSEKRESVPGFGTAVDGDGVVLAKDIDGVHDTILKEIVLHRLSTGVEDIRVVISRNNYQGVNIRALILQA